MSEPNTEAVEPSGPVAGICDSLTKVCQAIAALALLCIVAINGANVVARYFFAKPFPWAEEAMIMFMIFGVFAGAIAVTWRNMHIRIDTFVERAAPNVQRVIRVVATLASMAVLFIVSWSSFGIVRLLLEYGQTTDALEFPMWIPQSFVTIGLVVIALLMFTRLVLTKARA
jgi:TRAP-type C4-dicarboxylate transport system permease small subunit